MQERKRPGFAYVLSFLIHIALIMFLLWQEDHFKKESDKKPLMVEWIEVQPPAEKLKNVQIVEQDEKPLNDKVPDKDYKLSRNNQDVKKETKAAQNGEFKNRRNTAPGEAQRSPPQQASRQQKLDLFKPTLFDNQFSPQKLAPAAKPAISGDEVSQNDDYLKDVVAGSETLLRTREFVYYSYYNRIKRKLKQHWEPRIKEKIVKILRQGRTIASVNDKVTRLVITLDENGELVRIQVRNASGYNDLDDAAIEAFRAAAPFPNPPEGIVDGSGKVEINWDFVLET